MFSISLEYLKPRISPRVKSASQANGNSKANLRLPLERTALEQVNYTKWYYSDESKKIRNIVKEDFLSFSGKNLIQFNYKDNSFELANPVPNAKDDFYFLLDYIKDSFLAQGYFPKDSVLESISHDYNYIEIEFFYLVNEETNESITLEIRRDSDKPLNIKGFYTTETHKSPKSEESEFIKSVKNIFEL